MKLTLNGHTYTVIIPDLNARPVQVLVDGVAYEVAVTNTGVTNTAVANTAVANTAVANTGVESTGVANTTVSTLHAAPTIQNHSRPSAPTAPTIDAQVSSVLAPLPGVVAEVHVASGATVVVGQPLCAIEAMKMKNLIRATRAGTIAEVHITNGQQVRARQVLVTFAN